MPPAGADAGGVGHGSPGKPCTKSEGCGRAEGHRGRCLVNPSRDSTPPPNRKSPGKRSKRSSPNESDDDSQADASGNSAKRKSKRPRVPVASTNLDSAGASLETKDFPACGVCFNAEQQHKMAQCQTCAVRYHVYCMNPPRATVPDPDTYLWYCNSCMETQLQAACKLCERSDGDDSMLLCDGCNAGYHMGCLQPPLVDVPFGDWYCPQCALSPPTNAVQSGVGRSLESRTLAGAKSAAGTGLRKRQFGGGLRGPTQAQREAWDEELRVAQKLDGPSCPLPPSSFDLALPRPYLMDALQVYEVLRRFSEPLGLTPFRFEDLCFALISSETSPLLANSHATLLRHVLSSAAFSEGLEDDLDWALLDEFTWPFILVKLLVKQVHPADHPKVHSAIVHLGACSYDEISVPERLAILVYLTDEFLGIVGPKAVFEYSPVLEPEDFCRECRGEGNLLCCEVCPAVYHLHCLDPPLSAVPAEAWFCPNCEPRSCHGVSECVPPGESERMLRSLHLGEDRCHRRYTYGARRIFVETESGEVAYYSSVEQLDVLLAVLSYDYERRLVMQLQELYEPITTQMKWTLTYTARSQESGLRHLDPPSHDHTCPGGDYDTHTPSSSEANPFSLWIARGNLASVPVHTLPNSTAHTMELNAPEIATSQQPPVDEVFGSPTEGPTSAEKIDQSARLTSANMDVQEPTIVDSEMSTESSDAKIHDVATQQPSATISHFSTSATQLYSAPAANELPTRTRWNSRGSDGGSVEGVPSTGFAGRAMTDSLLLPSPQSTVAVPTTLRECAGMGIPLTRAFDFLKKNTRYTGLGSMWRPGDAQEFRGYKNSMMILSQPSRGLAAKFQATILRSYEWCTRPPSRTIHSDTPKTLSPFAVLVKTLLKFESTFPGCFLYGGWLQARQEWITFVSNATTVKELGAAMLVLEDAVKEHVKCDTFVSDQVKNQFLHLRDTSSNTNDPNVRQVFKSPWKRKRHHGDEAEVVSRRKQYYPQRRAETGWMWSGRRRVEWKSGSEDQRSVALVDSSCLSPACSSRAWVDIDCYAPACSHHDRSGVLAKVTDRLLKAEEARAAAAAAEAAALEAAKKEAEEAAAVAAATAAAAAAAVSNSRSDMIDEHPVTTERALDMHTAFDRAAAPVAAVMMPPNMTEPHHAQTPMMLSNPATPGYAFAPTMMYGQAPLLLPRERGMPQMGYFNPMSPYGDGFPMHPTLVPMSNGQWGYIQQPPMMYGAPSAMYEESSPRRHENWGHTAETSSRGKRVTRCSHCGEVGHYVTSCMQKKQGFPPVREFESPRSTPRSPSSPMSVRRSTRQSKTAAKYVPSIGGSGGTEGGNGEKSTILSHIPPSTFSPKPVLAALISNGSGNGQLRSGRYNPLQLSGPLARTLGRKRGALRVAGIAYKGGYSCGFRFLWRYRVANAKSVSELMIRFRVLAASIRESEMEPPSPSRQEKEPLYTITNHRSSGFRWWYFLRVEGLLDDGTSGVQEDWFQEHEIDQLYAIKAYRAIVDRKEAFEESRRREKEEQLKQQQIAAAAQAEKMRENEAWQAEQRAAEMASTEAMRAAALLPQEEYTFTDTEIAEFNMGGTPPPTGCSSGIFDLGEFKRHQRWQQLKSKAIELRSQQKEDELLRRTCRDVLEGVIRYVEKLEKNRQQEEERVAKAHEKARQKEEARVLREQAKREALRQQAEDAAEERARGAAIKEFTLELLEQRVRLLAGSLAENAVMDMEWYNREADRVEERDRKQSQKVAAKEKTTTSRKRRIDTAPSKIESEKRPAPVELFCVCRTPYDESAAYIGCDGCDSWFHFECVGLERRTAASTDDPYFCESCKKIRHFCAQDDTPAAIAEMLGVSAADLVSLNQKLGHPTLTLTSTLAAGTVFVIPGRDPELERRAQRARPSEPKAKKQKPQTKRAPKKKKVSTTSKSFACELCDKSFSTLYHLNRHLKVHAKREAASTDLVTSPEHPGESAAGQSLEDETPVCRHALMTLLTRILMNHRVAGPFTDPVTEEIAPDYFSIVARPMDLRTVLRNVQAEGYPTMEAFKQDILQIEANCVLYNSESSEIAGISHELIAEFRQCCDDFSPKSLSLPVQGGTAHALLGILRQVATIDGADSLMALADDSDGSAGDSQRPVNLATVMSRIQSGHYANVRDFLIDLQAMWARFRKVHPRESPAGIVVDIVEGKCAEELRRWARSWKFS